MSEHYFTPTKAATSAEMTTKQVVIRKRSYQIQLAPKVFSATKLDPATAILLEYAPAPKGPALDIGCGWGPITLGLANEVDEPVWAVDVNERARDLTKRNAQAAGFEVEVASPEEAQAKLDSTGLKFETIWSNPPIRIGKEALHELLQTWLPYLSATGIAYLVVGNNLGAGSLLKWLQSEGWQAEKFKSKKGYSILAVRPAKAV
ncbi:MFS transporter [Boudabousia tangfeifanii]|uniref:MFS transporter n=1 Tax=Boudabousia tangfeifanii TaxID=1912795 RepID=A0A1D9MKQ3_9ACTO|nr:methyltransferase [Boudabousia tangfeifanii]AOZ72862.1 MFS transporter [Boudabousia tangfeifanii]